MNRDSSLPFTVIITTHNRADLLPRSVQSVLNQTFGEFEIIIVDDVSSDNTPDVVAGFTDPRICYVRTEKQARAAGARNIGARHARGELLVFLDDDDELAPTFLERVGQAMADGQYGFAVVWHTVVSDEDCVDAPIQVRQLVPTGETHAERRDWFYRSGMPGGAGGLITRRACYLAIGGCDETLVNKEDTDLLIRLMERYDFAVLAECLYVVHLHDGNEVKKRIRSARPIAQGLHSILTKHAEILRRYPQARSETTKRAAQYYYLSGNSAAGRKLLWPLLRAQPGKLELWKSFLVYDIIGLLPREWYLAIFGYLYKRRRQLG